MEKDLCPICGKTKDQFQPQMRVFCCPEHREEYYKHIVTWGELKKKLLGEHPHCYICRISHESYQEKVKNGNVKFIKKWIEENRELLEHQREKEIEDAESRFAYHLKEAFDDEHIAREIFSIKHIKLPLEHRHIYFTVDHIIPIALGGPMWDEKNLQVLCEKCNIKKTKKDLQKIREKK